MKRSLEEIQASVLEANSSESDRPEIVVNGRHMREISEDSIEALSGVSGIYERATIPVRLEGNRAKVLTFAALKGELERAADYVKESYKAGDEGEPTRRTEPARPPADVVSDILALPSEALPFPKLNTITSTPVLTPDGKIHYNGYDPETGILVACNLEGLRTDLPLADAVAILEGVFHDFPFVQEAGKAHALAMTLQPIVRHVIQGPTPLFNVEAPTRGTGKGLIVDVCTIITTGTTAPIMPNVRETDEQDKRITTLLLEGATHILWDNVTALRSAVLAAALTSEWWRGRILGKSESVQLPNHAVWMATGNNPDLSDEIARRVMPIRLDPGVERPEDRRGFKHPRLKEYVRAHRAELLSACLSIVNAWVQKGMPRSKNTIGSFESWAGVMGGILDVAGIPGLLGGREHLHELADSETREWAALLEEWHAQYGERPITSGELFTDLLRPQGLLLDLWGGRSALAGQQRLGHALKARRDRVFGGFRLRPAGLDAATRNAAYRVEPAQGPGVGSQHPKHPERPEGPLDTATSARVFVAAADQNTRETPQNTLSETQNTRSDNPASNGANGTPTGVPGVSGVISLPADLQPRAAALLTRWAKLSPEALREKWRAAAELAPETAKELAEAAAADPLATTVALSLHASRAGTVAECLAAARAGHAPAPPKANITPPPGAPL